MVDWLVVWGVTEGARFAFRNILVNLAKEGLEDYVKDFFKDSVGELVSLAASKPLKIAFGQAQKEFLDQLTLELEDLELTDEEIMEYEDILLDFTRNKSILAVLGKPVEQKLGISSVSNNFDAEIFTITWNSLAINPNYKALPDNFDWQKVKKRYERKIDSLIAESKELRELLNTENIRQIKESLEQQSPILPEFDLGSYQQNLEEAYKRLNLDSLALSGWENSMLLWNIFIPQDVEDYGNHNSIPISVLDLIDQYENYKYVVIIGNPGAGKSTLTRYKVMQWTQKEIVALQLAELPILIELKNYLKNCTDNNCRNFLEYIQYGSGVSGGNLNQQELHQWLTNNQSIVMFDGLDEIIDAATRDNVVTDIINFKNTYPKVRIFITSRIIGYEKSRGNLRNADFETFVLKDFDTTQIKTFVDKWHEFAFTNLTERELKRDRLQRSIDNFPAFQELAKNPLLLTMMAILNRHEELPRDRATLYERASEILLYKWEAEKYLPIDEKQDPEVRDYLRAQSNYKDKIAMLRLVAHKIHQDGNQVENNLVIDEDALEDILTEYLKEIIPSKPRIIARAFIKDITDRSFILCFLGDRNYGFIHKTFLEYFCASHIVHLFEKKREITIEDIKQDCFIAKYQDEAWHETLILIVNILDETWAKGLLQCVIDKDGSDCEYKNLFLAAKCLSDIRNIRQVESIIPQLSTKLEYIASGQTNSSSEVCDLATEAFEQIQLLLNPEST